MPEPVSALTPAVIAANKATNQNLDRVIDGCPAPVHSAAIVHRSGGIPAEVFNVCGHCGEYIVRVSGVWLAICQEEAERLRKGWKR